MSRRSLMLVNVVFRLSYGVGGLLSPSAMARLRLAPNTSEHPEARLFVRGFSAHQIAVAALGIAGLRWRRLHRPAAVAAATIDAADVLTAAVEAAGRGQWDADLTGGALFSAAGAASAWAAFSMPE